MQILFKRAGRIRLLKFTEGTETEKAGTEREEKEQKEIQICPTDGVRYTVPCTIRPEHMEEKLTVRFRVGNVFKNCYVSVYFDDQRVTHRKRQVVAPGEMEEIVLTKKQILETEGLQKITVKMEEK